MNRRLRAGALAVVTGAVLAACSGPPTGADPPATPVDVLYAASLTPLMTGPLAAAARRDGLDVEGVAGGSDALVNEVLGHVRPADVVVSAAVAPLERLEVPGPSARWTVAWASTSLVLGYDPRSRFAAALRAGRWASVVTEPGFRLGRTDPSLDPMGALAVAAVHQAATGHRALLGVLDDPSDVFPEASVLGRLEAGQLDAAFLYRSEAVAAQVPWVSIAPAHQAATFALTVLGDAPHRAAARKLAALLVGPTGRRLEAAAGMTLIAPPEVTGSGVPAQVRRALER